MLETLRRTRAGAIAEQRRKKGTSLRSEMSSHFPSQKASETSGKPKKTKRGTWKHKFVCLPYHKQDKIPTYEVEKDEMFEADLGEKLVEFDKLDMKAEEFCDVLYNEGGGFCVSVM